MKHWMIPDCQAGSDRGVTGKGGGLPAADRVIVAKPAGLDDAAADDDIEGEQVEERTHLDRLININNNNSISLVFKDFSKGSSTLSP